MYIFYDLLKGYTGHYFVTYRLCLCGTEFLFMDAEFFFLGGGHGITAPPHATGLGECKLSKPCLGEIKRYNWQQTSCLRM